MYGHGGRTQRAATAERVVASRTGALQREIPPAPQELRPDRVLPPTEEREGLRQVCVRYSLLYTAVSSLLAVKGLGDEWRSSVRRFCITYIACLVRLIR